MTRSSIRFRWFAFLACAIAALLAGCGPSSPIEQKVSARNPSTFATWRARLSEDLRVDECKEFDFAVQQIKVSLTEAHAATGVEAVEAAMLRQVNGKTVRQVLQAGLRDRFVRLKADRKMLEEFIQSNATIAVDPSDSEGKARLRDLREDQTRRLKAMVDEINQLDVRLRLLELGQRLPQG